MSTNVQIYEFASSIGAFEGYVYQKKSTDELDLNALSAWMENIVTAYKLIPQSILEQIQPHCDQTLGRAKTSLIPVLGENDNIVKKLDFMIEGDIPEHPDDFQKTKWFDNDN